MIASVQELVLSAGLGSAVIEVGGVGLLLHTTAATAASLRPGTEATLTTTLVVREESLTLYGFADENERTVFSQVQTVSGVGPDLPWRCWQFTPRRPAPGHQWWRSRRADEGPGDWQEGRRTHRAGAPRQDRCSFWHHVRTGGQARRRRGERAGAGRPGRPRMVLQTGRGGGGSRATHSGRHRGG